MSYRRSLSFTDNEEELLKYFDDNGKSDIAKEAMKFYRENKDKVITEGIISILKAIGFSGSNNHKQEDIQKQIIQDKFSKLKK